MEKPILTSSDSQPHICEFCQKTFSYRSILLKHKRIHTGEKPFKCQSCEQSFSQVSNLIRHSRTHSNLKPYVCNICSKGFTSSSNLKQHIYIHKSQGIRQKYSCFIKGCNKSYLYICTLKKHCYQLHHDFLSIIADSFKVDLNTMNFSVVYKDLKEKSSFDFIDFHVLTEYDEDSLVDENLEDIKHEKEMEQVIENNIQKDEVMKKESLFEENQNTVEIEKKIIFLENSNLPESPKLNHCCSSTEDGCHSIMTKMSSCDQNSSFKNEIKVTKPNEVENPNLRENILIFKKNPNIVKKNFKCLKELNNNLFNDDMNIEEIHLLEKKTNRPFDWNKQNFPHDDCWETCGNHLSCPEMTPQKCQNFLNSNCDCLISCKMIEEKFLEKGF